VPARPNSPGSCVGETRCWTLDQVSSIRSSNRQRVVSVNRPRAGVTILRAGVLQSGWYRGTLSSLRRKGFLLKAATPFSLAEGETTSSTVTKRQMIGLVQDTVTEGITLI